MQKKFYIYSQAIPFKKSIEVSDFVLNLLWKLVRNNSFLNILRKHLKREYIDKLRWKKNRCRNYCKKKI